MSDQQYFARWRPAEARDRQELGVSLAGREMRVWSGAGVFSAGRLDPGTRELLAAVPPPPPRGRLLDLGCGWGPLALALAALAPDAEVWAVDVNPRALNLTRRNAQRNGLRVRVAEAAQALERCRSEGLEFARIWCNPPVHVGKPALHALLADWLALLAPGGEAWLVVARNLGSDSLARWLAAQGFPTRRHSSRKGYRVLVVHARNRA